MSENNQSDCGCCTGIAALTPATIYNPPGLSAVAYRVGTYAQFKYSMLAHLSDNNVPALMPLKTRADDDFSLALLDSWAMVADVLTFYQERIANESYKRTAKERGSLLNLARLVNYKLQPGVAADTFLAFTMESALGSPDRTTIGLGTKVQSLPEPGEKPQVFETTEVVEARSAWSIMKPGLMQKQSVAIDATEIIFQGTNTRLKSGDILLIIEDTQGYPRAFRRVKIVTPLKQQTMVQLEPPLSTAQDTQAQTSGAVGQGGQGQSPTQPPDSPAKADTPEALVQDVNKIGQDISKLAQDASQDISKFAQNLGKLFGGSAASPTPAAMSLAAALPDTQAAATQTVSVQANLTTSSALSAAPVQRDLPLSEFQQFTSLNTATVGTLARISGISQHQLEDIALVKGWSAKDLLANIAAQPPEPPDALDVSTKITQPLDPALNIEPGVYALRVHASLFGYNAPDWNAMPDIIQGHYPSTSISAGKDWPLRDEDTKPSQLALDRVYPQILKGSWLVVEQPGKPHTITQVQSVQETAAANYALNAKISQLGITTSLTPATTFSEHRQVTVYAQSEKLPLADVPNPDFIAGDSIAIPALSDAPGTDRTVIVVGQSVDTLVGTQAEIAILTASTLTPGGQGWTLNFKKKLGNTYRRETVSVYGNIVRATQGETIQDEILGSGDASLPYQKFTLRQSPLTYIQASTEDGKQSTLTILVGGLQWKEVDTFYQHGPREHIYVTHIEDDGSVTVTFGDGNTGARLPTGEDNVHANYRKGTGLQGIVQPGQLSILQTRPLGVKSVTNPFTPTGADDPDTIEDARRNASNTIFTLGRVVSKADYEEYALSYARVAKAQATTIWTNSVRSVYVTIAGPPTSETLEGTQITEGGGLYEKIYSGIRSASDPTIPFVLRSYDLVLFTLSAKVKLHANAVPDQVLSAVEQVVLSHFSFNARNFGQGVALSEVIAVIQEVSGVMIVTIDLFYNVLASPTKELYINAKLPQEDEDGTISLAELLVVSPNQPFVSLEVMP